MTSNTFSIAVNPHGFTWDAGNRYVYGAVKTADGWKIGGGHLWETGQPRNTAPASAPNYNPNTGELLNGWWVLIPDSFIEEVMAPLMTSKNWLKVDDGRWCDALHRAALVNAIPDMEMELDRNRHTLSIPGLSDGEKRRCTGICESIAAAIDSLGQDLHRDLKVYKAKMAYVEGYSHRKDWVLSRISEIETQLEHEFSH
jgi:hypothetical protein